MCVMSVLYACVSCLCCMLMCAVYVWRAFVIPVMCVCGFFGVCVIVICVCGHMCHRCLWCTCVAFVSGIFEVCL